MNSLGSSSGSFLRFIWIAFSVRTVVGITLFCGLISGFSISQANAQSQQNARSVSGMFSTGHTGPDMRTRSNVQLPSTNYHVQIDLSRPAQTLPSLDMTSVHLRAPNQIGVNRAVLPLAKSPHQISFNADGSSLIVFVVRSQGAAGMGLHFRDFHLRPQDQVYVYGMGADSIVCGPFGDNGPWGTGEFWSGTVNGDTVVIEFYSRTGEKSAPFELSEVSHIFDGQAWQQLSASPDVLGCELDASCYTDVAKNAVGRIMFNDQGVYVCTGTLLADSTHDQIPYFLTANHCVSSQSVAQTVEVFWFYQTTSCDSGILRNWLQSAGGASFLAGNASNDFALLRLVNSAPSGTFFSAWNSASQPLNASVVALHHPGPYTPPSVSSYLRRSSGTIVDLNDFCNDAGLQDGYNVSWTAGTIEGGSSGSGLFNQNHELIGALSCGPTNDTCSNSFGIYSKFSDFYSLVQQYLDPPNVPSNDRCAGAIALQNGVMRVDSTAYATSTGDPTPTCVSSFGNGLWYTVTPTVDGTLTISTCGSDFDTVLQVYTGSCSALVPVTQGCDDDNGPSCPATQASVSFTATSGVTYRILVGGYGSATGNLHMLAQLSPTSPVQSAPYDFNSDNRPDYLLFNSSTGQSAIWYMNNNSYLGGAYAPTIPSGWQLKGVADYNGDGYQDYALFNPSTRQTSIWYLNGPNYVSNAAGPTLPSGWQLVATADINRDGRPDFILYNSGTLQTAIWYMNNNVNIGSAWGPTLQPGWILVGLADFNRDGNQDYLLFNPSTLQTAIWYLSGPTRIGTAYGPTSVSGYAVIGAVDYNGDNSPDYVLYNSGTQRTAIWYMNNNARTSTAYGPTLPASWSLIAP
jgi:hypothetical protein